MEFPCVKRWTYSIQDLELTVEFISQDRGRVVHSNPNSIHYRDLDHSVDVKNRYWFSCRDSRYWSDIDWPPELPYDPNQQADCDDDI